MKDKRFEAAVRVMAAFQADPTNEETIQADATHAVECADALLAALGESALGVPELPEVALDRVVVDAEGDRIQLARGSFGVEVVVATSIGNRCVILNARQLLDLTALCIAHYREMTKGGAS